MIVLREFADSDVDGLVLAANNANVARYLLYTFPHPYTQGDARWWIRKGSKQNGAINRVIEHQGLLVGTIGITPQAGWRDHVGEIGYWLAEEFWGMGIATEAVRRMTEYGFTVRHLRKLYATVLAPNGASMRVLEKCGYRCEGILQAEVQKHGTYFDLHHYSALNKHSSR
jgi:RimJ/RimL family protein N-acetyltransferase